MLDQMPRLAFAPILSNLTARERSTLVWPMSDELSFEAAMVIWETIHDLLGEACNPASDPENATDAEIEISEKRRVTAAALEALREEVGTCQLRHFAMSLIEPLHVAWRLAEGSEGLAISFDWEFAPFFMTHCVEIDTFGLTVRPGWEDMARQLGVQSRAAD